MVIINVFYIIVFTYGISINVKDIYAAVSDETYIQHNICERYFQLIIFITYSIFNFMLRHGIAKKTIANTHKHILSECSQVYKKPDIGDILHFTLKALFPFANGFCILH